MKIYIYFITAGQAPKSQAGPHLSRSHPLLKRRQGGDGPQVQHALGEPQCGGLVQQATGGELEHPAQHSLAGAVLKVEHLEGSLQGRGDDKVKQTYRRRAYNQENPAEGGRRRPSCSQKGGRGLHTSII